MLGAILSPVETNSPLTVDPDAVLPGSVALERFQPIGRKSSKIVEPRRRGKYRQSSRCLIGETGEFPDPLTGKELCRPLVATTFDHRLI